MTASRWSRLVFGLTAALGVTAAGFLLTAAEPTLPELKETARTAMKKGNFKDAYEALRKYTLDPKADPKEVGGRMHEAIQCLQRLGRSDETDEYRDEVIKTHAKNWRLLWAAAESFLSGEQYGFIIAGKFQRGQHRGGGEWVQSSDRDRVRGLQLLEQAMPLTKDETDKASVARFYTTFARNILMHRGQAAAWRLQSLTDLKTLPDYDPAGFGWGRGRRWGGGVANQNGAPVDADGNPVFHAVPESWETAKSDGERWRWLLKQATETDKAVVPEVRYTFASFLRDQFDVQTMQTYGWFLGMQLDQEDKDESGPYAVHTLKETETIARLATGAKRFALPEEFNFIRLFRELAESGKGSYQEQARTMLAAIFTDRRQYPQAAKEWKRAIADYGPGPSDSRKNQLDQIVGNWGRFENVSVQPAGSEATLDYRFRNGKKVTIEAREIKIDKLLADVKAYLQSNPKQLDWSQVNIGDIGYRLIEQRQTQYVGERVTQFEQGLTPRDAHFDERVTVKTSLKKAGAYLITAQMEWGNTSRIIVWVADTMIAQKQLEGRPWYFVADAVTGEPIPKANVEFFGFKQDQVRPGANEWKVSTHNFAELTDKDGQAMPEPRLMPTNYQWLAVARSGERLAYLGFQSVWYGPRHYFVYDQNKVFTITDRPVYRPGQPVKFKFWVRNARYDKDTDLRFAAETFKVRLTNPRGETVWEKPFTSDEYGGFDGEHELPADAALGQYQLMIVERNDVGGGGGFRVEEYKKPEFEVKVDAPSEPVALGEKIQATVTAKYYFGAPVTNAKAHVKVTRTKHDAHWYPPQPWDWFYGPGYWWFSPEYSWYPRFHEWGCIRPIPPWWGGPHDPPEVVSDATVDIGPDGTVKVDIDTALAKAVHSDQDHKYEITAEVTDQSRRTIVGQGNVLVARKPFKVFAWLDRGHYRTGDTIRAAFKAQTLDQKPVTGKGKLKLFEVTYTDGKPVEKEVQSWDLDTDEQGHAEEQIKATKAGQYRLAYTVTDKADHAIEGGYLFNIYGEKEDTSKFRFNDLELILEKKEYKPGDKIRLMVNTNRPKSTVALFIRAENGICRKPVFLRLEEKSTVYEIPVETGDMPNFFIEAFTVADARLHTDTREAVVPPEKRVANVQITATSEEYKPGAEGKLTVKLTDTDGKPFVGSTVLTVYDKSVEYISGGSNVPEIKEFFWKFRRNHHPQTQHSLGLISWNLHKHNELSMNDLGAFGHLLMENEWSKDKGGVEFQSRRGARNNRALEAKSEFAAGFAAPPMGAAAPMLRKAANGMEADRAMDALALADATGLGGIGGAGGEGEPAFVEPTVRKNFADTALWVAKVTTNDDGIAEMTLKMPENLTTWKVRAWTMGKGVRVGQGETSVITTKHLLVRLQAPRFFTETDEVVLSANVHNYLPAAKKVKVSLEMEGETLALLKDAPQEQIVEIEPKGEKRVDWRVKATREGTAVVRMKALSDEESDAMEMKFPVYIHGMLKTESFAGFIKRDDKSGLVTVNVPEQRRINQTKLEVRYSPTLAGAMVDALPYLVSYPHNTTDTTLNRFLPTVITQNILKRMEIDLKEVQKKRTNLNAQEIGDDAERAKQWKRYEHNPVFDEAEVDVMTKSGVQALTEMQLADGGWGWFSGWGERSDAHTTALVVHGLQIAQQNGIGIVPEVMERGAAWLKAYQDRQVELLRNHDRKTALKDDEELQKLPSKPHADNLDALVYMVLIDGQKTDDKMHAYLYRDRIQLAVYAKALFGLACHTLKDEEKLAMVMKNIDQFLVQDDENQTAYLKLPEGNFWWHWYGSDVEANAYYLKLLAKTEPKGEKASRLVKYLLNNRKNATYWNSTRDTAIAIEAMAEFLVASGEDKPDLTVEVWFDGEKRKDVKITKDNLFTFDNRFEIVGDAVETGEHKVELRKQGAGPLYFNAYLTNFTLEDFITKAGLEIKVQRKYYKLTRSDKTIDVAGQRGQPVGQRVEKYERSEIKNLGELKSGDLLEIELEIDSKNDYEYLVFDDLKAAGCEPVDVRSGYTGNALGAYVEFRDERATFFVRYLARGKHSVAYRLRAETPGKFSALPAKGFAMYAPELRGNSDEMKLLIAE